MLAVVADKTGYPVEMLELGMDMVAGAGSGASEWVEMLGAAQDVLSDLPELNPEDLAELRTRLIRSVLALLVTIGIVSYFAIGVGIGAFRLSDFKASLRRNKG